MIKVGTVVQFNENHCWCGCLGIITEAKKLKAGNIRYMVGVPVPEHGTEHILVFNTDNVIEKIGRAVMVEDRSDD